MGTKPLRFVPLLTALLVFSALHLAGGDPVMLLVHPTAPDYVREAVRASQIYTARTFNYSSLIVAAILFLLASVPLARFTDRIAQRDQERRLQRTR